MKKNDLDGHFENNFLVFTSRRDGRYRNLNEQSLSLISYFAPEIEDLILNFGDCLLRRDSSLRELAESFPSDVFDTELQNFVTIELVSDLLTSDLSSSAFGQFLDDFDDVLADYVVDHSQPIPFLDRPLDQLYRKDDFFATFERVAASSYPDLVCCLGGVQGVGSLFQSYLSDEGFQRRAIRSYWVALAHEFRKFDFKQSLKLVNDLPITIQGGRSKSLVDLLPEQPREIASIFFDRPGAKKAADSFYQRWLNWLPKYFASRKKKKKKKKLSGSIPANMDSAQSIEDARPHWKSALNLVVAKLNRQFHLKPTSSQIKWLRSDRHWQDMKQRLQDEVDYATAVNARGPLYAGKNRSELIYLDGLVGEEDFDGDHRTLHEVFLETTVQPDHNIDPLNGQMIVLAIERDYDSFADILGATGTDVLRLKSLREGEIGNNQIAQQIGKSERTVRREGQKRKQRKQQVLSNVRKILKIG